MRYDIVIWCIDLFDYILRRKGRLRLSLSREKRANEGLQLHKELMGFLFKLIEPSEIDISMELMQRKYILIGDLYIIFRETQMLLNESCDFYVTKDYRIRCELK